MNRNIGRGALIAVFALGLIAPSGVAAEEYVPLVDGATWKKSAPILKRAYLIGVSNLMTAEYLYQKELGPPPDNQTTIQRLYEEIEASSLNEAIDRIDQWYEKNPDQLKEPVLVAIWLDMVEPNLKEGR